MGVGLMEEKGVWLMEEKGAGLMEENGMDTHRLTHSKTRQVVETFRLAA